MLSAITAHLYLAANACGTRTGILPSLYDNLKCTNGAPEIRSLQDTVIIVANIVRILIAISGSLAVIAILIASVYYITATGDPARTRRGKDIILYTMVGLVLIILSYAIVTYIAGYF